MAWWPHHLHYPNVFVSSPIRLIILNMHTTEICASNQIKSRPYVSTARPGGHWSTHQETFIILVTAMTFLKTKLTSTQGKSPSCVQQSFHLHHYQGVLKDDIPHASTSGWSARKLTTWIIRTSIGRSTSFYVYMFIRGSDVSQASSVADSMRKLIA